MAYNHETSAKALFSERYNLLDEFTKNTSQAPTQGLCAARGFKDLGPDLDLNLLFDNISMEAKRLEAKFAEDGPLWPTSETDTGDEAVDEAFADTSSGGEECDDRSAGPSRRRPGSSARTTCPSLPPTPPPTEPPAQREAGRVELSEDGLVDLEESEGRKRGSELMMMIGLGAAPLAKAPPPPPKPPAAARPARGPLLATAAPFEPRGAAGLREPHGVRLQTRATTERTRQSNQQATSKVLESSSLMYLGIVREAALRAFGDDMAHVEGDLSGGFNVQLSDQSRHCSAMERLEELRHELWPRLPCDSVAALEPGSIGKRAWLTMHYVLVAPPDNCWDYASTGCCPRGQLCRWPHALPQNLTVDIEVAR